jgi:hypothetical protein
MWGAREGGEERIAVGEREERKGEREVIGEWEEGIERGTWERPAMVRVGSSESNTAVREKSATTPCLCITPTASEKDCKSFNEKLKYN